MQTVSEAKGSLEQFILRAAGANSVSIKELRRMSGGAIQENWLLDAEIEGGAHTGRLEAVLRCDAHSEVSVSHGRSEEFALLSAAFKAGVTVPEPLWACENRALIGRQFFVMRRIRGTAAAHLIVKNGRYGGDRKALVEQLGSQLALIHSIKPPQESLAFLPWYQEEPAIHQVTKFRSFLETHHSPHPALEWGLCWLERHSPDRGDITLCHGDFRTGNYMVDEQGLTGILDWEFASWSEPLQDIGWFCAKCWRFGHYELEAGGIGNRDDFYRGYERVAAKPIDREQVRYWEVMAHVKWAIISLQQAQRHISGEEESLLLALTAHVTPELEYEILNMTESD